MDNNFDYSTYVGVGHNSADELSNVARLAEAQNKAQENVNRLEEELKAAKEELRKYAEKLLPEEMEKLGLSTYNTTSGISVSVKEQIRATLSPENRPKGFAWLEEHGFGGLIKSNVVVPFKRNEIEEANKLVEKLGEEGKLANLERKVEAQTLMAFVREQLAQGKDIPIDVFGVFRQRIAKVET